MEWVFLTPSVNQQPCGDCEPHPNMLTCFTANACRLLLSVFKSVLYTFKATMSLWTLLWSMWLLVQAVFRPILSRRKLKIYKNRSKTGYQGCEVACLWHRNTLWKWTLTHTDMVVSSLLSFFICAPCFFQVFYFFTMIFLSLEAKTKLRSMASVYSGLLL